MSGITIDTINESVKEMQYAVRGAIVTRAGQIEADLATNPSKYPFDKVVMCNIGNPQSVGQKPITFFRQVLSLCDYPEVRAPRTPRPSPSAKAPPDAISARPTSRSLDVVYEERDLTPRGCSPRRRPNPRRACRVAESSTRRKRAPSRPPETATS